MKLKNEIMHWKSKLRKSSRIGVGRFFFLIQGQRTDFRFCGSQVAFVVYGHASHYCALLNIFAKKGLWPLYIEQIYQCHFFPIAFFTLCLYHILVILTTFKIFHYYYICCGDLGSVIIDVTIVIVLGCSEPHPYKTANLIHECYMYPDCSTTWPFPHLSPLP